MKEQVAQDDSGDKGGQLDQGSGDIEEGAIVTQEHAVVGSIE